MSRPPFARRYWNSLTGAGYGAAPATSRTRDGYTFWERYWASLTVRDLPARPAREAGNESRRAPTVATTAGRPASADLKGEWFRLPPVPAVAGLRASDDDDVLTAATLPGGVELFVRRGPGSTRYRIEVVARRDEELPAIVRVRYPTAAGQRVLLVPVAGGRFGVAASQADLPGMQSGAGWEASGLEPAADIVSWEADAVADSLRAAASMATLDAWQAVRDAASDDLRAVIDRFRP